MQHAGIGHTCAFAAVDPGSGNPIPNVVAADPERGHYWQWDPATGKSVERHGPIQLVPLETPPAPAAEGQPA